MKAEEASKSCERVLSLLMLLLHGYHSRQEIVASIADYARCTSPDAQRKMLDRDFSTLERTGIQIDRQPLPIRGLAYSIPLSQFQQEQESEQHL